MTDPRRTLPQIDAVLREIDAPADLRRVASWIAIRELDRMRAAFAEGRTFTDPAGEAIARVRRALARFTAARPARVVNATGVLLHTNLGRAPLADAAVEAIVAAAGTTALEYRLDDAERGGRGDSCRILLCALTGAEDAFVVNNNAGALVLTLAALAKRREVIVSRGELVEIGGAFRLPAVMEAAGALLREVGTTNRTHARDVRDAIGPRTSAILRVHPSNFTITGFTTTPSRHELIELARGAGIVYLEDLGSGLLEPDPSLPDEPDATRALREGADLVCFSGDKLIGGPQAGIIAGRAELVEACRGHPLARALRADKLTLAALDATLGLVAAGVPTPVGAMRATAVEELRDRAERIVEKAGCGTIVETEATLGGGSAPGRTLPSIVIALDGDARTTAERLRRGPVPIVARIADGRLLLDLRSVEPRDDAIIADALTALA